MVSAMIGEAGEPRIALRVVARQAVDGREVVGVEAMAHAQDEGERAKRGPGGGWNIHRVTSLSARRL